MRLPYRLEMDTAVGKAYASSDISHSTLYRLFYSNHYFQSKKLLFSVSKLSLGSRRLLKGIMTRGEEVRHRSDYIKVVPVLFFQSLSTMYIARSTHKRQQLFLFDITKFCDRLNFSNFKARSVQSVLKGITQTLSQTGSGTRYFGLKFLAYYAGPSVQCSRSWTIARSSVLIDQAYH